ncbi:hypothetical protein ACWCQX_36195, partial [Streptomyces sp. NPDC002346]
PWTPTPRPPWPLGCAGRGPGAPPPSPRPPPADINRTELPRLSSGETVLFLAERSTSEDVQSRIVDLLAKIGTN